MKTLKQNINRSVYAATALAVGSLTSQACQPGPWNATSEVGHQTEWYYVCRCVDNIGQGSGTLVHGTRVVLTDAHVVYNIGSESFVFPNVWRGMTHNGNNYYYYGYSTPSSVGMLGGFAPSGNQVDDHGYILCNNALSGGDTASWSNWDAAFQNNGWNEMLGYPAENGWDGATPGEVGVEGSGVYYAQFGDGDPRRRTDHFYIIGGMSGGPIIYKWGASGSWGWTVIGTVNWTDGCTYAAGRRIDAATQSLISALPTN